ncbi:hypothetical protein NX722_20155 [Endozoicomonas gorgoniicola]|uniref:Uncharacterized protein n=1 Tax=Endozoicomonas gorgoniicola TaxID=1234144 RepID=A0ABT3MZS9_9GAMM|nr:hypothetical protein [Endozoicomonas gorgoniicola]MCW7554888.1 hypothetical protein [Endozoicomonas gorgoniicola]
MKLYVSMGVTSDATDLKTGVIVSILFFVDSLKIICIETGIIFLIISNANDRSRVDAPPSGMYRLSSLF